MKKLAALLLTAVLVIGSVLPCFALESPGGNDSGDYSATDENGEELPVNPTDEEIEEIDLSETGYVLIDLSENLSDEYIASIFDSLDGYDEDTASIADVYEVTLVGETGTVAITVPATGVTEDNLLTVLFKAEGSDAWVAVDSSLITVNDDGTITIGGITVSGEVAIIVKLTSSSSEEDTTTASSSEEDTTTASSSEEDTTTAAATGTDSEATTTTSASGGESQKTGDISIVIPVVLLVVAAVAIVILLARGKKEEN